MAGVAVYADIRGLAEAGRALEKADRWIIGQLTDEVAQLVENQTKARISDEKEAPDGSPWPEWADSYEVRQGQSMLEREGHLLTSIQNYATAEDAVVGSNLEYAAIHQMSGEDVDMPIPARPYLGLSRANEQEVSDLILDRIEELVE